LMERYLYHTSLIGSIAICITSTGIFR
jgi:hypothetical protein